MALLSTKGVYGLAAILEITVGSKFSPVSIADISDRTGISKNYLEQILNALKRAKIISSLKGKNGGYYLSRQPSEITFREIFAALERDFCVSNIKSENPNLNQFFVEYDERLKSIFDEPLSSYDEFVTKNEKYLDFSI